MINDLIVLHIDNTVCVWTRTDIQDSKGSLVLAMRGRLCRALAARELTLRFASPVLIGQPKTVAHRTQHFLALTQRVGRANWDGGSRKLGALSLRALDAALLW